MWNVTVKGLMAHKLRLALTALAVVIGVTFISGALVLTDTLHDSFTALVGNVYQRIDLEVRGDAALGQGGTAVRNPIPDSILATVRSIPGVASADGSVTGYSQYVAPDGNAISNGTAPTAGISFDPNSQLSAFRLVAGTAPATADDVAMDLGTATKYHFALGAHVRILLPQSAQTFTITGFLKFGNADNLAGATIAAFDLPTAQQLLGLSGQFHTINVLAAPGADKTTVQHAIAATLPAGVEVVTGQTVVNEQTNVVDSALSGFSTALLVFALIALFVGGFTIFNTFSIIVGQRTRELALLRIVGASRRQIFRSVLAEAAAVGLAASAVGLGLGVAAARGLEALLSALGVTLPSFALVVEPRTVLVALGVGVGVTVASALGPARRAVRIPPVVALGAPTGGDGEVSSRRRILTGGVCVVVSVAVLAAGLAAPALAAVGIGAAGIFVGIAMLAPLAAQPIAAGIGRPLAAMLGISGRLGRENSMRNPRRTAQTAAALMVGLALVSAMAVYGASLKQSATTAVDGAVRAQLIVTGPSTGFPNSVLAAVADVPGVAATTTVYQGQFEINGSLQTLAAVSTANLADNVILHMKTGTAASAMTDGQLLIDTITAKADHLSVGSPVAATFARTGTSTLRIGGIYQPNSLIGHYLVGSGLFLTHYTNPLPIGVLAHTDGNDKVAAAVNTALNPYPTVGVQTTAQYQHSQEASVNLLLGIVYALLALAVLVALIGIVNTLLLTVSERTHEIGLLRAVGMKRRQIRAMIRSEAVIVSLFGALTGIAVGTALGTALAYALERSPSQSITAIVVPLTSLIAFLAIAALLGLGAAAWPARRAAKLDILAAIATD
jgi:putative ABC transport system permease protein